MSGRGGRREGGTRRENWKLEGEMRGDSKWRNRGRKEYDRRRAKRL